MNIEQKIGKRPVWLKTDRDQTQEEVSDASDPSETRRAGPSLRAPAPAGENSVSGEREETGAVMPQITQPEGRHLRPALPQEHAVRDEPIKEKLRRRFRPNYPISAERTSELLNNVVELSKTRLNTSEADKIVNKILDSGDYLALDTGSAAFAQNILGWPADNVDTWLLSFREHRWAEVGDIIVPLKACAEVELQGAGAQANRIEKNIETGQTRITSPDSQTTDAGMCSSGPIPPTNTTSGQQSMDAPPGGNAGEGEQAQGSQEMEYPEARSADKKDTVPSSTAAPVKVRLADLDTKNAIQCRAKLNRSQIKRYRERMKASDRFPPIEVFRIGGLLCITDGLHRVEAALALGLEAILCIIRDGTRTDAIKAALRANINHGVPRTNADKRNAVKLALETFPNLSHHQIAELCLVSQPFVGKVQKQLISVISSEPRLGRDGKMRRLPTKQSDQSSTETPRSDSAIKDQCETGDRESQPTRSIPNAPAALSEREHEASVVRQDLVQAVVAKIEKLLLAEIDGLVEAEIVAVFDGVKRVVSL